MTLMEEIGITCRVGHPATIGAAEPRRQKHDRRDAALLRDLLAEGRFRILEWARSRRLQRTCSLEIQGEGRRELCRHESERILERPAP